VRTVNITGQHPLMLNKRPGWYFEPGKHGGTINDIGIHTIDTVQWLTGGTVAEVTGARVWNGKASATPWFKDCAQFMLKLSNEVGVISDVSYLSPDTCGFTVPQYWRITVHGDDGVLECNNSEPTVMLATSKDKKPRALKAPQNSAACALRDFVNEINGQPAAGQLTTDYVLRATHAALQIQQAADQNKSFPFTIK
jgi:predicted dehydrogenase